MLFPLVSITVSVRVADCERTASTYRSRLASSLKPSRVDLTNEQILEKLLALNIERANDETKSAATQRNGKKISRMKSEHEMI